MIPRKEGEKEARSQQLNSKPFPLPLHRVSCSAVIRLVICGHRLPLPSCLLSFSFTSVWKSDWNPIWSFIRSDPFFRGPQILLGTSGGGGSRSRDGILVLVPMMLLLLHQQTRHSCAPFHDLPLKKNVSSSPSLSSCLPSGRSIRRVLCLLQQHIMHSESGERLAEKRVRLRSVWSSTADAISRGTGEQRGASTFPVSQG